MSEVLARVWWDPHDGRLQVTIEGTRVQRSPELRHANLRVEWSGGSWAESSISVPKKETTPARTRQAGNLADILGQPDTTTLLKRIAELESRLEDANDELEFLRPRATGH